MRHGIAGNKLNRHGSWRKATVRDMAKATLIHQRIETTKIKAKEARKLVDKLITLGKKGTLAHKRRAFAILCDHKLVSDLFNNIAPRFSSRQGGYTRIIPLWNRRGDNAQLALLELTEQDPVLTPEFEKVEKTTTQESSTPTAEEVVATPETTEVQEAEIVEEATTEEIQEAAEAQDAQEDEAEATKEVKKEVAEAEEPSEQAPSESSDEDKSEK